jgi:hypothetical protein
MSDLLEEITDEYPKTVTVCHAEIKRLNAVIVAADKQLEGKDDEIAELKDELDEIEEKGTVSDQDAASAINAFLDECERVGPLRFDVPQSDRTNRAIVGLHDVVGRKP